MVSGAFTMPLHTTYAISFGGGITGGFNGILGDKVIELVNGVLALPIGGPAVVQIPCFCDPQNWILVINADITTGQVPGPYLYSIPESPLAREFCPLAGSNITALAGIPDVECREPTPFGCLPIPYIGVLGSPGEITRPVLGTSACGGAIDIVDA